MAKPASKPPGRTFAATLQPAAPERLTRIDSSSRQSPFRVVRSSSHSPIDIDRLASVVRKILDQPSNEACIPGPTERGMSVR
jgi:hypothetical protein